MGSRLAVVVVLVGWTGAACGSSGASSGEGAGPGSSSDAAAASAHDGGAVPHDGAVADGAASDGAGSVDAHGAADAAASDAATAADGSLPPVLGTTDGTVAAGWYCGKNPALMQHVATWNAPSLKNDANLFRVAKADAIDVVGYCTLGCTTSTDAHDHCVAPQGAPIAGKECFDGAGAYCGHTLGIEARSYPVVPGHDQEGLFDCSGATDVSLTTNCACQVTPGGADECATSPGRRLWIAYETGTTTCVPELTGFWDCMLAHSSFDDLVLSYGTGYTLSWGGIAQVPSSCGTDYGCAVSNAKFAVGTLDVVLVVTPGGVGGQNDWTPMVTVGGKTIAIHGAHIGDASGNCDMQTAYSMHEVYEATTDPGSADCCDGEVPYTPSGTSGCLAWNSGCSIACQKWGPSACGGDGSYGLAKIQCAKGTYLYQRVSPATDEYGFGGNQCLAIMPR